MIKSSQKAFTLIELLVVVAIIGILAAVGVTTFSGFQEKARKSVAESNFKLIERTLTKEITSCLLGFETNILNRAEKTSINPRGTPIISCADAFNDTEDLVRAFHPIFKSMKIRNPHNNPVSGKVGEYDVNVGAHTESLIKSNHNQFKDSTWPGLIHITSISPNRSKKSIAIYTKTGKDEPIIHKVIILE